MAAALARDGEVILASVIEVTGDAALTSAQPEARARRRLLDTLAADMGATHARSLVTVARVGWDAIRDACATERPDLLLVSWNRPGWDILGTTIEEILRDPPADVAVVKGTPGRAKRILVPVRGGRYARLAARIGTDLARARDGAVTLLHVSERGRRRTTLYELLGELVDKWFVENTFTSSEFADLRRLVEAKERQNVRISVGLPTLNEEATIRKVIRAIRSRLMERVPLVDEIVVIDSRSEDRTRELAAEEGVPVFIHDEILPETGTYRGKGEALWKSLHVMTGDIVTWIDTDVSTPHPKFVYGIVGALLMRPDLQFVKAFYQRPLRLGDDLQASGGGRVTELAARPILNLFFPELSGIVQPLSGEQAGRRTLLEQLPFFSGYGVETGLLVDTLQRAGLSAIGQVDMKQRIHRNQSLYDLSKMSFEVLQVAIKRVGEAHGTNLLDEANFTMKLIAAGAGKLHLEMHDIIDIERPPIATIPAYQARRNAPFDTAAG